MAFIKCIWAPHKWCGSARNEGKKSDAVFNIIYPTDAINEINPLISSLDVNKIMLTINYIDHNEKQTTDERIYNRGEKGVLQ